MELIWSEGAGSPLKSQYNVDLLPVSQNALLPRMHLFHLGLRRRDTMKIRLPVEFTELS